MSGIKFLGYEIEIPDGAYKSMGWNMYVSKNKTVALENKEIAKAKFIKNPIEAREKKRQAIKGKNDNEIGVSVSRGVIPPWKEVGFDSLNEYFDLTKKSMFYGMSVNVSTKRHSEIEAYVMGILEAAKAEHTTYAEICNLIDKQYEQHTGVFDHAQSDLAFREQYNQLVYDILEKRIWEVWKAQPLDPMNGLDEKIRNPLRWNATALSLGTVLGSLHDEGIIKGTKTDLHRAVNYLFGISTETTKAAMNHKTNEREGKVYYDPETVKLLKPWIDHLKTTAPKTGKLKQAKKKP